MPDFRLIIDVKDVADADASDLAQRIWDEHAEDLDAKLGDFSINVLRFGPGSRLTFDTSWEPNTDG
jgi:hypothetical protein